MHIRVIIMCKAPVAGKVKTRLTSHYSAQQAADLHAAMATAVITRSKRLFDDVVIAADDCTHPFFATFGLPLQPQGEGDLGTRMQHQMQLAFSDGVDAIILLGTDSPHMSEARLNMAVEGLHTVDVVIGPVEDGGYEMMAMRGCFPLFEQIAWSSESVLSQTMAHVRVLGLSSMQLEMGFDVDFPEDILRSERLGWSGLQSDLR